MDTQNAPVLSVPFSEGAPSTWLRTPAVVKTPPSRSFLTSATRSAF